MKTSRKQKDELKQKAADIAEVLKKCNETYHGSVEIQIRNGVVVNIKQTESIDMR